MVTNTNNIQENNQNFIKQIKKYLKKKGHSPIFSMYLENYNKTNLYVSFDFVKKLSIYRVTWFDLNFRPLKKLDNYQNSQIVSKKLAFNIIDNLNKIKLPEEIYENPDIIGDRVYITLNNNDQEITYGFTRFLPIDWGGFIDPIVLLFSYLPRNMDIFLQEIFAIFDGTTDIFTYTKPIKFDLLKTNPHTIFKPVNIEMGTKYYAGSRVLFLEEIEKKYFAIVNDREPHLVILNQVDKEHAMMWCNCKKGYLCSHIYATLLALRYKSFNNFYKVKYNGDELPLLEKLMYGNVYLCYGINNDKILLLDLNGNLVQSNIMKKNHCLFDVIEDDDECSLSKILDEYKNK